MNRHALGARVALAAAALLLAPLVADVAQGADKSKPPARKPAKEGMKDVAGLRWYTSVDGALKAAAGESTRAKEKPVMVLRVLGDLDGFM